MPAASLLWLTALLAATPAITAPRRVVDEPTARPLRVDGPLVVYLNGGGVTLAPGASDSTRDTSPLAPGIVELAPAGLPPSTWAELLACVREAFGPFDAVVTDVDPGAAPHVELVVAASSAPLGFEFPVSGIAPFRCDGVDRAIAYTFVDATGATARNLCWTAVQEIGHTLGLEHELLCGDPMTYLGGCPNTTFQDVAAHCGETQPRPCECGGDRQNSYVHLLGLLGPGDAVAPALAVTSPAAGAVVDAGFAVTADARDPYAVTRMWVELDGALIGEDVAAPWAIVVPARAGAGPHRVRTTVRDPAGNVAVDERDVTVRTECAADPDCGADRRCVAGVCLGELGASCPDDGRCADGACRGDLVHDRACRATCTLGDDTTCAPDERCAYVDGAAVCMPPASAVALPAGGCAAGDRGGALELVLAGAAASLPVLRRRRRRP